MSFRHQKEKPKNNGKKNLTLPPLTKKTFFLRECRMIRMPICSFLLVVCWLFSGIIFTTVIFRGGATSFLPSKKWILYSLYFLWDFFTGEPCLNLESPKRNHQRFQHSAPVTYPTPQRWKRRRLGRHTSPVEPAMEHSQPCSPFVGSFFTLWWQSTTEIMGCFSKKKLTNERNRIAKMTMTGLFLE